MAGWKSGVSAPKWSSPSLQDTSTYTSKSSSVGGSVTIGAGGGGSFNASKSKTNSEYASVNERSGIEAGDAGFQVNVGGNTNLAGGAIASNQTAVDLGANSFSTGGTLTTSDIQNHASYSASGMSIGAGWGGEGENKGIQGVSPGYGKDGGNASSTTTAAMPAAPRRRASRALRQTPASEARMPRPGSIRSSRRTGFRRRSMRRC